MALEHEPREQLMNAIAETLGLGRMRLAEISFRARPKLEFAWPEFVDCIEYLVSSGLIERKGDGFAVNYSLTEKGLAKFKLNINWRTEMG